MACGGRRAYQTLSYVSNIAMRTVLKSFASTVCTCRSGLLSPSADVTIHCTMRWRRFMDRALMSLSDEPEAYLGIQARRSAALCSHTGWPRGCAGSLTRRRATARAFLCEPERVPPVVRIHSEGSSSPRSAVVRTCQACGVARRTCQFELKKAAMFVGDILE